MPLRAPSKDLQLHDTWVGQWVRAEEGCYGESEGDISTVHCEGKHLGPGGSQTVRVLKPRARGTDIRL